MAEAAAAAADSAAQQRIIKHMNADHQDSLRRYLEYTHHLSSAAARNARMISIAHTHIYLTTSLSSPPAPHTKYLIPLDPPLKSWREARERLVALDRVACTGLHRSDITIKEYISPRGIVLADAILSFLLFSLMCNRANLSPGNRSSPFRGLIRPYPALFSLLYKMQPWILYPLFMLHAGQTWWMDHSRLQKHSVPRLSGLWWKWMVTTFMAPTPSIQKVDQFVEGLRKKRENQKH